MNDWPLRKLGDDEVCLLNPKKREVAKVEDSTPISFVPMARVDDVSGTMDVSEVKSIGEVRKGYTYFAEGDVVFAKITPCMENGKSAIARNLMNGIGFGTTEFHVLRSGQLTTPEWLHLFVRDREFREEAKKNMHGAAGQQRVPVDFLREATIPLPPVDEQRRIVARIEELTRRAEEARKLRQEALEEVGNTVTAFIDQLLYDLPRSCWKPIETYAKLQGGYAFKSDWFSEGGMRLLRNQNIYHDEIDWTNDKTVFLPNAMVHEFERFALLEGDIVLTMDRPLIKSGLKASRIRQKDLPCLLLQRVGRFLCSDEINKDYLFQCLLSQVFTSQISGSERSNAVPHISSKQVEGISIPIPPLAVQLEVVEKTEKFREKLTLLCSLQNETSNDLEAFQSALLAKAFRGEL